LLANGKGDRTGRAEREHLMITASNLNKKLIRSALGGAGAAVAATASLIAGAGTAHADCAGGCYQISLSPWDGGVTVHIANTTGNGEEGWCTYNSKELGGPGWYQSLPFFMPKDGYDLVIWPTHPDNLRWIINMQCDNGTKAHDILWY
jgi:hypothetical protein